MLTSSFNFFTLLTQCSTYTNPLNSTLIYIKPLTLYNPFKNMAYHIIGKCWGGFILHKNSYVLCFFEGLEPFQFRLLKILFLWMMMFLRIIKQHHNHCNVSFTTLYKQEHARKIHCILSRKYFTPTVYL